MVSPHRYSSHALVLLAMLFVTGCFAAASVMSLADEAPAYPFRSQPTELLQSLDKLSRPEAVGTQRDSSGRLPPDVLELLERTNRGAALADRDLIDAFLIASGVFDKAQRDQYSKQLDLITVAAGRAIAASKTPRQRGDALLKFLHAGPMKAGYDADQTRLSVLIDTGRFNCVSATSLYQIVARRLGLGVQAVSIPGGALTGHAMSMLVDGDRRIDVETTNPDGFNFQSKVKASGATVIGVQLDPASGHDVSELGLASLIAQNIACGGGKDKDHLAAIQAALIGLALDPLENAQANNFVAAVNEWAMLLGERDKYEEALAVMQFGLHLLPAEDALMHNADLLWNRYAAHEARANRPVSAVAVVRRAIKAGQAKATDEAEAAPFISVADDLADAEKWRDAVAVLDQGLQALDGGNTGQLKKWLVQVHREWAEAERQRGDPDAAIQVLAALWKRDDGDPDVQNVVAYFAQETLAGLEQNGGPDAAAKLIAKFRAEFKTLEYLDIAGKLAARRGLEKLLAARKYAEAAAAIERYQPLLTGEAAHHEIGGLVFDSWGRELIGQRQWEQAVKVYGNGLKQYSTSDLLKHNIVMAWDKWAAEEMKKGNWLEAIRIYERALESLGDNSHLKHNLAICRRKAQ